MLNNSPLVRSETYETEHEVYPKVTVEIWNIHMGDILSRLVEGEPVRLSVSWPELATRMELMLIPLDNDFTSRRMTGTDEDYFGVGITRHGFYGLKMGWHHPSYLQEKFNVGSPEATALAATFKFIGDNLKKFKDGEFEQELGI